MAPNGPRPPVHIVVTCTNRKRFAIRDDLKLGSLHVSGPGSRFATWTKRLTVEPPTVKARDLYSGEHWNIARSLPALVGDAAELWVCSAGYGLVHVDTHLHPYAATFALGSQDSVGRDRQETADWWQRLASWTGPGHGHPRSFKDLARQDPNATIVAVLSATYLYACADDLREASDVLESRDKFIVIGATQAPQELEDMVIPIPAVLRAVVGGSLHALHARVTAHLLSLTTAEIGSIGRRNLRAAAEEAIATAPIDTSRRAPGKRLDDEAVREFINLHRNNKGASATKLLRQLRDSGLSCEQGRFKKLYNETIGEVMA